MKVGYISVYRDGTGYGHASEDMIQALDSVGVDVVPIWLSLSGNPGETTERIKKLEEKDLYDVDIVIQTILPSLFHKIDGVPCIGNFFWETTHFKESGWTPKCNQMDEIWVCTEEQANACKKSGVYVPVKEFTQPHNLNRYDLSVDCFDFKGVEDRYKFYTIGDLSHRKNIAGLITSFYCGFKGNSDVCLIIKGFLDGGSKELAEEKLKSMVNSIRSELKIDPQLCPPILFIAKHFTEEEMLKLHKTCDCFVTMSRGEGECYPAFDAAMMENQVIVPNWNGTKKMFKDCNVYIIDQLVEKFVIGMKNTPGNLYNPGETWFDPSTSQCAQLMKSAFKDKYLNEDEVNENIQSTKKVLTRSGYEEAGLILKRMLEEVLYESVVEV